MVIGNALPVHMRDWQFALMHTDLIARVSEYTQVNTEVSFAMLLLGLHSRIVLPSVWISQLTSL